MTPTIDRSKYVTLGVIWLLLLTMPYWLPMVGGYMALGTRVVIMGLAAMSLNFLLGFTGVLSFGHAAFFGLGAYGTGLALKYFTHSTPLALVLGVLLGGIAGAVLGALIVRRRGVYFAMVTIAFGQVFYFIAFRWNSLTGGDDGLRGFERQPIDFGVWQADILHRPILFYYFVLLLFAIGTGAMGFLLRSPFGRTLLAIRENERRARFLGVPIEQHIWLSFSLSCFFVALAGGMYALLNNFADPTMLNYTQSGEIVIMIVLGGIRSFWGPLIGAAIFVVLQDYLSSLTTNWMSFLGTIFVLMVLFFPRGVLGLNWTEMFRSVLGRSRQTRPQEGGNLS
ncbi:MAG: branched-chain amino acid ABC transporter permease [Betaproteobacteria bacterium]|nr:branched-chain amino acid ABC transporter permease [Betaproteobacteria bacterium]